MALPSEPKFIDIGINLTDPIYSGVHHGKKAHEDDLHHVIDRARRYGVRKLVVTGSDLAESSKAVELARRHPELCTATCGVHPCSANTFFSSSPQDSHSTTNDGADTPQTSEPDEQQGLARNSIAHLASLRKLILDAAKQGTCAAIGEIGLDYDRLFLADKETQLKVFEMQLDMAVSLQPLSEHSGDSTQEGATDGDASHANGEAARENGQERLERPMPLFLHSRAAHASFVSLLRPRLPQLPAGGVVHSFTGTLDEMHQLVSLGLDIGVNGCSLKTVENLEVVREIPLERMQLETDGPWCEIRASSAGMELLAKEGVKGDVLERLPKSVKKEKWTPDTMVKGRNEPCMISLVAEIVARVKGCSVQEVVEAAWENSGRMFGFPSEPPESGNRKVDGR